MLNYLRSGLTGHELVCMHFAYGMSLCKRAGWEDKYSLHKKSLYAQTEHWLSCTDTEELLNPLLETAKISLP